MDEGEGNSLCKRTETFGRIQKQKQKENTIKEKEERK